MVETRSKSLSKVDRAVAGIGDARAPRTRLAWPSRIWPLSVTLTPRDVRTNNSTPSSSSRCLTCWLKEGWAIPRRCEAAESEPNCAMQTK